MENVSEQCNLSTELTSEDTDKLKNPVTVRHIGSEPKRANPTRPDTPRTGASVSHSASPSWVGPVGDTACHSPPGAGCSAEDCCPVMCRGRWKVPAPLCGGLARPGSPPRVPSSRRKGPGRAGLTDEGVEGGVGADAPHLVDGLEGQDVFLRVRAAQRAAGAAAGAQVPGGERHRAAGCRATGRPSVPSAHPALGPPATGM